MSHYNGEYLLSFFLKCNTDFFTANVIKYVLREEKKGGIEDVRKALHYLRYLMSSGKYVQGGNLESYPIVAVRIDIIMEAYSYVRFFDIKKTIICGIVEYTLCKNALGKKRLLQKTECALLELEDSIEHEEKK